MLFYILACLIVLLFIRAPLYVLLVFVAMCSVFWLFWLSFSTCQVIGSKDSWGSRTVARGSSQKQAKECIWFSWFILLFHCSIVCVVPMPYVIYIYGTSMARYSMFVLKVPLNNNKPNQTTQLCNPSCCRSQFYVRCALDGNITFL